MYWHFHGPSRSPENLLGSLQVPADEDPACVQLEEPPEAVEPPVNEVRAGAGWKSGWVESGNPESIPLLIRYLRGQEEVVQLAALAEFAGMSARARGAVPAILAALNDSKSSIRVEAAATLIRMNVRSKAALGALTAELNAEEATSRARAAQALGDLIDPPAVDLGTNCWGPSPPPRIARPWVGKLALPALVGAQNDPDPAVRAAAAQALSRLERFTASKGVGR
jgi:HEAT repeat protein